MRSFVAIAIQSIDNKCFRFHEYFDHLASEVIGISKLCNLQASKQPNKHHNIGKQQNGREWVRCVCIFDECALAAMPIAHAALNI